ncbi:hypothetical protein K1D83_20720, partial [Escherichia coli]|nr:hypothetical protein [Escherichia coli]
SLKTSIKTITYLSDIGCLEIQGASLPTKDTNWNSTYIYKSRHEMLPVNLTQETLFSSKSHGKYALFPIFTASWRAHRIMNKGV